MPSFLELKKNDQDEFLKLTLTVMNHVATATIENCADFLFDVNQNGVGKHGNNHISDDEKSFMNSLKLKDMSFGEREIKGGYTVFPIINTLSNKHLFFSDRGSENCELRGKTLREGLDELKNKNPDLTLYDAITNLVKNAKYSGPYAGYILLSTSKDMPYNLDEKAVKLFSQDILCAIQEGTIKPDDQKIDSNQNVDRARDIVEFLEKIENYFMNRKEINFDSLKINEQNFIKKMDSDIEFIIHRKKDIKDEKLVNKLESKIQDNINLFIKENTTLVTSGFKGFINSVCKLFNINPPYKKEDITNTFKENLINILNKQTDKSESEDIDHESKNDLKM